MAAAGALKALAAEREEIILSEAEPVPEAELSGSAFLLAGACTGLGIFYFAQSEDAEVHRSAWGFAGSALRTFLACMFFDSVMASTNLGILTLTPIAHDVVNDYFLQAGFFFPLAGLLTIGLQYVASKTVRFTGEVKGIPTRAVAAVAIVGVVAETAAFAWRYALGLLVEGLHAHAGVTWPFGGQIILKKLPILPVLGGAAILWMGLTIIFKSSRNAIVFADGRVGEEEKEWLRLIERVEVEAGALMLSMVSMQILRFYLGGELPDAAGTEHGMVFHSFAQIVGLLGVGVQSAVFAFALISGEQGSPQRGENGQLSYKATCLELMKAFFANMTVWSSLTSFQWLIQRSVFGGRDAGIAVRFVTALGITTSAVGILLGKVHQNFAPQNRESAKVAISTALAVASGFAWERCFSDAFLSLAHTGALMGMDAIPSCGELCFRIARAQNHAILSGVAGLIIYPALYYHIAPRVLDTRLTALPEVGTAPEVADSKKEEVASTVASTPRPSNPEVSGRDDPGREDPRR
jgi:hypothetical protein